jgi:Icc-related predicted phosphoesterase
MERIPTMRNVRATRRAAEERHFRRRAAGIDRARRIVHDTSEARHYLASTMPRDERTIAVIGDVHAHWRRLDFVLTRIAAARVDLVLLVGDIGSHDLSFVRKRTPERDAAYLASVDEVLRRARAIGPPVLYVPGNHDLPELAFAGNVDGKLETVAGVRVHGIGGAGPGRFGFAYEWDEAQIAAREAMECDVILSHTPPARTALDLLHDKSRHVGSEAIRARAARHDGVLVCGHIHEAAGAEQIERCLCLNAGGLGAPFGRAQVGFVRRDASGAWECSHEDLESGVVRNWARRDSAGTS